jgi:mannosyltransferase OCH1-like enzyme
MIPNNIILTYKDNSVPKYVFDNIKSLNSDKNILFFTDEDIIKFLSQEYESSYVDFFNSLKLGCTKGDFFRYCYLFKYGGYYCDIDICHLESIKSYITSDIEFFTINSGACKNTTFQALLFTIQEHPIIKKCIDDIMMPISAQDTFYSTTGDMYKNITQYLNTDYVYPGDYISNSKKIAIGQEIYSDQWVCTYHSSPIALSRYPNYIKYNPGTNKEVGLFI